jgi:hypothetical protein
VIAVLVLIALLAIEAPENCSPLVVPIPVTRQAAPINGAPVLVDGAAVTVRCHY